MKYLVLIFTVILMAVTASANSYPYKPLLLPKSSEITAFSNGLPPGDGERNILTRDELLKYLDKGASNTKPETWPARRNKFNMYSPCDGVLVDRSGKVYFWFLVSPGGLRLETADGESAYLELQPENSE